MVIKLIDSINFNNWTPEQYQIMDYYLSDEMRVLKKICNPLIYRKGVESMYHDDLYAVATDTLLESIENYDDSKGSSFRTFLTGNINRAYYDWTRDQRRFKRCNLTEERDEEGELVKDKNGKQKYVVIPGISIDASTEDGFDLYEKIPSTFQIEDELSEEIGFSTDDKWECYLAKLSKKQKKIAVYLSDGYRPLEIREILHITEKEYSEHMSIIKAYENISILF